MKQITEFLLSKTNAGKHPHDGLNVGDIIVYDFCKKGSYYMIMSFDDEFDDIIYTLNFVTLPNTPFNVEQMVKHCNWEWYAKNESFGYGSITKIIDVVGHYDLPEDIINMYAEASKHMHEKIKKVIK